MTKKKNNAVEGLLWILILLPLFYLASVWNLLPNEVPTHFDANGTPDDWSEKPALIYIIGGLNVFIYLLMKYLPSIDPKNNVAKSTNYSRLRVILQIFSAAIGCLIVFAAMNEEINSAQLVSVLLAFLFVGLGNYLQNIKPNYFVGVRTPWTLESENVWRKTHRSIGRLWFYGGLLLMVVCLSTTPPFSMYLVIGFALLSTIYAMLYSYLLFQKEKGN